MRRTGRPTGGPLPRTGGRGLLGPASGRHGRAPPLLGEPLGLGDHLGLPEEASLLPPRHQLPSTTTDPLHVDERPRGAAGRQPHPFAQGDRGPGQPAGGLAQPVLERQTGDGEKTPGGLRPLSALMTEQEPLAQVVVGLTDRPLGVRHPADPGQAPRLLRRRADQPLGVQGLPVTAVGGHQIAVGLGGTGLPDQDHPDAPAVVDPPQQRQRGVVVVVGGRVVALSGHQDRPSAQGDRLAPQVTGLPAQPQGLLHPHRGPVGPVLADLHQGQQVQRGADERVVAVLPTQPEPLLAQGQGQVVVATDPGQLGPAHQRPRPRGGLVGLLQRQQPVHPVGALRVVVVAHPVRHQAHAQPQTRLRRAALVRPAQQGTQGVVLGDHPLTAGVPFGPGHRTARLQLAPQVLHQEQHPFQKTVLEGVGLARGDEPFLGEPAYGLGQPVAHPALELAGHRDERTVQQGGEQIQDVRLGQALVGAHLLGELQIPPAEHRQAPQQHPLGLRKTQVDVVQHQRQHLVAGDRLPRPGQRLGGGEVIVHPSEQLVHAPLRCRRAEHLDPQRHPAGQGAQGRHGLRLRRRNGEPGVSRTRAVHEQPYRFGRGRVGRRRVARGRRQGHRRDHPHRSAREPHRLFTGEQ